LIPGLRETNLQYAMALRPTGGVVTSLIRLLGSNPVNEFEIGGDSNIYLRHLEMAET
jgi:hypothetical protein